MLEPILFRWRKTALVVAAMMALACLAVIFAVLRSLRPDAADGIGAEEMDAPQLLQSAHVALAHLENHETQRAAPLLSRIAAALPDDPFGPRNLAVLRVLALGEEYERATAETLAEARSALAMMQDVEGATAQWHWLAARVASAARDEATAEEHLLEILNAEPRNASAWYELFLVRRTAQDPQIRPQATAAIARACELRGENLFVLLEYLRNLEEHLSQEAAAIERLPPDDRAPARRAAVALHGDVAARLRQARQTLGPFRDRLLAIGRVDVLRLIDEAINAAENHEWKQLAERAGQVARVVLGIAAPDRNHIRRHVLEFVLVRFRSEFYEQYDAEAVEAPSAIDVSYSDHTARQISDDLRSRLKNVRQIELADFDLDGRLDVIVLDQAGVQVLTRASPTESWKVIAQSPQAAGMRGLAAQDLDLDFDETPATAAPSPGEPRKSANEISSIEASVAEACVSADVDVVAFGEEGVVVLRNRFEPGSGTRSLEVVEQVIDAPRDITAAGLADLDADGDLDLVLSAQSTTAVWSNRGNATFDDVSSRSSLPVDNAKISGMVALDWDRDVDVDVLLSGEPSGWLENLRHGQLRWHPFESPFEGLQSAGGFEAVDADGNASWDLLAARGDGIVLVRTVTPQGGVVRAIDTQAIGDDPADHIQAFDYDNDGLLDLLAWSSGPPAIYRGLPYGRFQKADVIEKEIVTGVRDCKAGDLDGDGDIDLAAATVEGLVVLNNEGGNKNRWLDVSLKARQIKGGEASASGRVNAHGIGSLLELKAGAQYGAAVVRGQTTHFGLGPRHSADVVRAVWLNGVPQNIVQPASARAICEQQLLTGSCPYLYAWNGTSFEFVTDLLWASPLGLQAAEGVLLPWRDWEYIKIPAEQLQPKSGEYVLQLTEELWEAAYFDQVKLIAVDHPSAVDVYTNEKVGPADIAHFKIHTATAKRTPVAARNHRGRDLLAALAKEDQQYARPFDRKLRQGLVEDHFIELDLGDLKGARQVTLFLTGWIYPSGTSLNVAFSQNPELPKPRPPALLTPDRSGGWKETIPYMGFPGGKTKTIAVDITEALMHGDSRLRVATNLELYWDQIFFTADEPAVEVHTTELAVRSARLHWRGFSRIAHGDGDGPERFFYNDVSRSPKWPAMQGRFTRYGDVTELLQARDDRLLVVGAGDEATLRFAAPDDPPPGWKRDFILYSVGWDKDANLCTVAGETVEPLPYAAMKNYPPGPDDKPPRDAAYFDYLKNHQTRRQVDAFWRFRDSPAGGPTLNREPSKNREPSNRE